MCISLCNNRSPSYKILSNSETSLVIKDLVYEAKAKAKTFFLKAMAKDIKIFQGLGYIKAN